MAKKLKLIFFIAFFLWICYIIKTKVLDLIVGNYLLGKKIVKYENKLKELSEKSDNGKKDIPINLFTLGSMYYDKTHDFEKAIGYFQQIISEFPDCDFAELVQFMIGDCYERLGRIELAVHEYKNYLQKYPNGKQAENLSEKLKKIEGQPA
ncbi:MAG TPA: tetratricopeptide repeat protein [Candidatus Wallbacteria bacterium]|nr:MAG: Tetratricopeptide repeat protein [bacterium ADurb.Bin243]HOT77440.1 tetratricopeptide repeat protein [Candidatus Wallbacteria bacterium]HPG59324.1 tetratricopeptide repeat protein [Candidatus Wallbacteria bacterium]